MNQRLEGWKLALAVLVPAAIVAGAIWFALQALSGDDNTSIDASQQDDLVPTATPTAPPETDEIEGPTVVPSPTPLVLPETTPAPTATAAPDATTTPTPGAAPTSTPSGTTTPSGPTPTPTLDPSVLTVTCTGVTFPLAIDEGGELPQLSAAVSPPERAATLQYLWNFGNGRTAGAPNTGVVVYDDSGSYTVTLQATDPTTGEVVNVTCGTVTVGGATGGTIAVTCEVRPTASIRWDEATINDLMRVTTKWTPSDVELSLTYEFGVNDPLIINNPASSGDNLTHIFNSRSDTVKIFWRNEATGASGRISCPAFTDGQTYSGAVSP